MSLKKPAVTARGFPRNVVAAVSWAGNLLKALQQKSPDFTGDFDDSC